jgi:diaminopimelate decarboxylase
MRHQAVTIHDIRDRVLAFDLIDILRLVGPDAESSSWRCRKVECAGDLAEELHRVSDAESPLTGAEMLRLAGGVFQIIDGDFEAYRPGETRPWLVVRAIDSSEYAVITKDERLLARVRERFRDVRDSPDDAAYVA